MKRISRSLKNAGIRTKITLMCAVLIVFSLIVGIVGIAGTVSSVYNYEDLLDTAVSRHYTCLEFESAANELDGLLAETALFYEIGENAAMEERYAEINSKLDELMEKGEAYSASLAFVPEPSRSKLTSNYDSMAEALEAYAQSVEKAWDAMKNNDKANINKYTNEADGSIGTAKEYIANLLQLAVDREAATVKSVEAEETVVTAAAVVVMILILVISVVLSAAVSKQISKPINMITDASDKIARGDFDIDLRSNLTNEIGMLSNNFMRVIDEFNAILVDAGKAFEGMKQGDTDIRINADNYEGAYNTFVNSINEMLDATTNDLKVILESVEAYSNGNFDYDVPKLPGKKAVLNEGLNEMKKQLKDINEIVGNVIEKVNNGVFDFEINDDGFNGDWKELVDELKELVENIIKPIEATENALVQISNGNFSYRIDESKYRGEFKEMAKDINKSTLFLSEYIEEISEILNKMAMQDLDVSIQREYIGDFKIIKDSLELIIKNFNKLIEEIMLSSEQVAIGSNSIADSSTVLAQGASQQASAVEELTATIGVVADGTSKNTDKILESNKLAEKAQESVSVVKEEMQELLEAMDQISKSSSNISTILQVIDDIAFQTNILSLNAAVEAARAGEQGKGFAIVADEVRNLAARSAEAVKDSSELIEESLKTVEQGNKIAGRTAETINSVISQIEKISAISAEVAVLSKEQNRSVGEINIGIKQISEVVSTNTATSEESAAASEELASQSAVFKEMVSRFNVKKRNV